MLESFAFSDTGRVRSQNEDYCLVLPDIGLYLLADGMGGAKGGERASRLAVETVANIVSQEQHRDASLLVKAVEDANHRIREEASRNLSLEGMGTTIVAALVVGENIAIASVGDSRAYLFAQGQLRAITEDQTWVREVGIPMGLDEQTLKTHPMRHVLTMAIGVNETVAVQYYMVRLEPSALLLLSSDGLHGILESRLMEKILGEDGPNCSTLEQKCRSLIEAACEAGGPDNITAVLVRAAA